METDRVVVDRVGGMVASVVETPLAFRYGPDVVDRFWRHVRKTPDGCWEWLGARTRDGYGTFATGEKTIQGYGRVLSTHRFAYLVQHGPIPPGLHVIHACDNKICVRGDHLRCGTHRDNLRDMCSKGRHRVARRIGQPRAKLTAAQVLEIRKIYAAGLGSIGELAQRYRVGRRAIAGVVRHQTWRTL